MTDEVTEVAAQRLSDWKELSERESREAKDALMDISSATQDYVERSFSAWSDLVSAYVRAWRGFVVASLRTTSQQTTSILN